jgi:hypothetical protein
MDRLDRFLAKLAGVATPNDMPEKLEVAPKPHLEPGLIRALSMDKQPQRLLPHEIPDPRFTWHNINIYKALPLGGNPGYSYFDVAKQAPDVEAEVFGINPDGTKTILTKTIQGVGLSKRYPWISFSGDYLYPKPIQRIKTPELEGFNPPTPAPTPTPRELPRDFGRGSPPGRRY